jgi:solute carrier family 9 (sodium/hydrogen exchanger), member 8
MDALSVISSSNSAGLSSSGPFSMLLLLVAIVIWSSHSISPRLTFLTEGSLALLWGLFAGGGFFFYFERQGVHIPAQLVAFNYDIYMSLLLPPIIFYAGFSIKKKHFFSNIGALATLGVAGTILLAVVLAVFSAIALHKIGLDTHNIVGNALALGVTFSSTDSVAALQAIDGSQFPQLHALVFGEAVVNDATAIVLLKAVQNIRTEAQLTWTALGYILKSFIQLSVLSMILGITVGLICAYILKSSFGNGRHSTDHEVSLLAALGFLSYLLAEWCNLSGVFSTFFCGLTMSHYAWHSLSPSAKVASVHAFRVLSFLAELCMFLSCGLDLWETKLWHKDILTKKRSIHKIAALVCWISISIPVARFLVALPLLSIVNSVRKPAQSISLKNRLAVSWAGCARGAVTLALAVNHFLGSGGGDRDKDKKLGEVSEENRIIAAAAMVVIVLSTVVLGGATPAIFNRLLRGANVNLTDGGARIGTSGDGKSHQLPSSSLVAPLLHENHAAAPAHPQTASRRVFVHHNNNHNNTSSTENDGDRDVLGNSLHAKWTHLDKRVFQPFFGGRSMSFRMDNDGDGDSNAVGDVVDQVRIGEAGEEAAQRINGSNQISGGLVASHFEGNQAREEVVLGQQATDVEVGTAALPPPPIAPSGRLSSASFGRVDNDVLGELFSHPGSSRRGPEVDREVEDDGLVKEAENCLEN